jgi:heptosyltransferase-2
MTRIFKRVLVIQTAFLGDAILSIPLLKEITSKLNPDSLTFVCRKGFGELFLKAGLVNNVIEVDKENSQSLKDAFTQMKLFLPDLIVSPHRSFRTTFWVARLNAIMKIGFKGFLRSLVYSITVVYDRSKHDVERQLSLLKPLGVNPALNDSLIRVQISDGKKFNFDKPFVVIAPGSQWNTKRWTFEGFLNVSKNLKEQGFEIVVIGVKNERELCDKLSGQISGSRNFCGQTSVFEMAQLIKHASLLICNDSGSMHIATAVGTPVVSIFGPTVKGQGYFPWSENSKVVEVDLSCRPCGAHGHDECPIGTHACMKNISASVVYQSAIKLLKPSKESKT